MLLTKSLGSRLQNLEIEGRDRYKKNWDYLPYTRPVSYNVKNAKVTGVGYLGDEGYEYEGSVISSGYIGKKKMQYIIPKKDEGKEGLSVEEESIRNYLNDYKGKENQLGKMRDYFALPGEGEEKPVFYIYDNGNLYFGFTPNLRLFFDHMIHDGLPENHKLLFDEKGNQIVKLDYNMSLFGFTANTGGYKSRLRFYDAAAGDAKKGKQEVMILSEPKPSSYLDYLTGKDKGKAPYNDSDFRLRGVKQYWLHGEMPEAAVGNNTKISTEFEPLESGTVFTWKIHFNNLAEDELGLLLWSLALEPGCMHNIGQGKPYGYGKIRIFIKELNLLDYEKMYLNRDLCLKPVRDDVPADSFISAYKEHMEGCLGSKIEGLPGIKDFFLMKNEDCIPGNEMTRYMKIDSDRDRNEYGNRSRALPGVKEVIAQREMLEKKDWQEEKRGRANAGKKDYGNKNPVKKNGNEKNNTASTTFHSRGNGFDGLKGLRIDE